MHDRIYQGEDEQWYYRVRGNAAVGPFNNRMDAERKLGKQLRSWGGNAGPLASWPRGWHPARVFRRSATRQT